MSIGCELYKNHPEVKKTIRKTIMSIKLLSEKLYEYTNTKKYSEIWNNRTASQILIGIF